MLALVRKALIIKIMLILHREHNPHKCPACSSISSQVPSLAWQARSMAKTGSSLLETKGISKLFFHIYNSIKISFGPLLNGSNPAMCASRR